MSNDEPDRAKEALERLDDVIARLDAASINPESVLFWANIAKAYDRVITGECRRVDGPTWTVRKYTSYVEIRIFGSVTWQTRL